MNFSLIFISILLYFLDTLSDGSFVPSGKRMRDKDGDWLSKISRQSHNSLTGAVPHKVGFGFIMGYSSGVCIKKISKMLAFGVGGLFILAQALAYHGYLTINYEKVEKVFDLNRDGRLDYSDMNVIFEKVNQVVGFHLPSGSGFAFGLFTGLKRN